eukprot:9436-Eustigmatos_ZCMA.PRE.1
MRTGPAVRLKKHVVPGGRWGMHYGDRANTIHLQWTFNEIRRAQSNHPKENYVNEARNVGECNLQPEVP